MLPGLIDNDQDGLPDVARSWNKTQLYRRQLDALALCKQVL